MNVKFPVNTPKHVAVTVKPVVVLPDFMGSVLAGSGTEISEQIRDLTRIWRTASPGNQRDAALTKLKSQLNGDAVWGSGALGVSWFGQTEPVDRYGRVVLAADRDEASSAPQAAAVDLMPEYDAIADRLVEAGYVVQLITQKPDGSFAMPSWDPNEDSRKKQAFLIAYDWRQCCDATAGQLASWLSTLKSSHLPTTHKDHPFTMVGHGMGGLVGRFALEQHGVGSDTVDSLIMVGTPNAGTLDAIVMALGLNDELNTSIFWDDFTIEEQGAMARSWDSVYQLLPTGQTTTLDGERFITFKRYLDEKSPYNDQNNEQDSDQGGDENSQQDKDDVQKLLTDKAIATVKAGLDRNQSMLDARDSPSAPGGVEYIFIAATGMRTRQVFEPTSFTKGIEERSIVFYAAGPRESLGDWLFSGDTDGDGMVPCYSALASGPLASLFGAAGVKDIGRHPKLMTVATILKQIDEFLFSKRPDPNQ